MEVMNLDHLYKGAVEVSNTLKDAKFSTTPTLVKYWENKLTEIDQKTARTFPNVLSGTAHMMAGFQSLAHIIHATKEKQANYIQKFEIENKFNSPTATTATTSTIKRTTSNQKAERTFDTASSEDEIEIVQEDMGIRMERYIQNAPFVHNLHTPFSGCFDLTSEYVLYYFNIDSILSQYYFNIESILSQYFVNIDSMLSQYYFNIE